MSAQPEERDDLDRLLRRLEAERYGAPVRDDRPWPQEDLAVKRARLHAVTAELDGRDDA